MVFDYLNVLTYAIGGNIVQDYLIAFLALVVSMFFLKIFKFMVLKKLKRLSAKTRTDTDDLLIKVIDDIKWPFFILLSVFISIQFIRAPVLAENILFYLILVVGTYYIVKGIQHFIDYGTKKIIHARKQEEEEADTSVVELLSKIFKIILWIIGVFFILSNLGYNITPMIAGLGIGGVAIAFALQNVLSDIFASVSLYLDKPFKPGDFIVVENDMGVVKKIGIKSTRLETLQGQELIMPNKELTETRVNNYKKMEKRRVVFNFGVVYQTPTEKLQKIPVIVNNIINRIELARIDRAHFTKFGDFSLNFEVVYYINTNDYNKYMDVQQEINLAIKEQFEKEGIEMAFPTQTVFINKSE